MADDDETPQVGQLAREVADWEYVSKGLHSYTQRKQVPGGWIYRTVVNEHPAMCFVPNAGEPVTQGEHEADEIERIEGHA